MISTILRLSAALSVILFLAVNTGGCKQKEGEICQIDDDCASGLICNAATGKCQTPGSGQIDAAPIVDAAPDIDAAPDAAVDAAPDAAVDAAPAVH